MKSKKIRKIIDDYGKQCDLTIVFFDNPAYDKSIIGITEDGRLIYDYSKMIKELAKDEKMEELEAMEFIDCNTLRALPYFGENKPIILYDKIKDMEKLVE